MPSPLVPSRFRRLGRVAIVTVLALCAAGLGGCDQREPQNPFIGPSGAAGEMPFGRLEAKPSGAPAGTRAPGDIASTAPGIRHDG